MSNNRLEIGKRVFVNEINVMLPRIDKIADAAAFQPVFIFSDELYDNRREGRSGIISRHAPGLVSVAWIVRHDDRKEAIYLCDELEIDTEAQAAADASALLNPAPNKTFICSIPGSSSRVRVEIYKDAHPGLLDSDALVLALQSTLPEEKRLDTVLHGNIRKLAGNDVYAQLQAAGKLAPLATILAKATNEEPEVPFKNVLFINGTIPSGDAVYKALKAANEAGCATVTVAPGYFITTTSQAARGQQGLMSEMATDEEIGEIMAFFVETLSIVADADPVRITKLKLVF